MAGEFPPRLSSRALAPGPCSRLQTNRNVDQVMERWPRIWLALLAVTFLIATVSAAACEYLLSSVIASANQSIKLLLPSANVPATPRALSLL